MNNDILFTEKQRMTQWWLSWVWILLFGMNGIFLYGIYVQIIGGQPFGDKPGTDFDLLVGAGIIFLLTIFLLSIRLDTIIKKDGIYIQFFPFHRKPKYYPWDSLTKLYFRQYAPLREFGGWGLRFGRDGMAYTFSGNMGLQLEFKGHTKVLIGTRKQDEMTAVLDKMGRLKA